MTPFAALDMKVKRAGYVAPTYDPGRMPSYAYASPASVAPAAPQEGEQSWGDIGKDIAVDLAMGSNPFTGVPYYGYQAVKDFSNGNILSGIGNLGWGAASFLGGGLVKGLGRGLVKGVGKIGGKGAAKAIAPTVAKIGAGAANNTVGKVGLGVGAAGTAGAMFAGDAPEQPQPQLQNLPQRPNSFLQWGAQQLQDTGAPGWHPRPGSVSAYGTGDTMPHR